MVDCHGPSHTCNMCSHDLIDMSTLTLRLMWTHLANPSDGRYDTKSIYTTDMILLKVGINTTNPVPRYQYFHTIFKLIQKLFYTPEQESCVASLYKDLCQGSKV